MTLPPALSRWAEPLAVLDPVLVEALEPLLVRLSAALGALGGPLRKGGDEPDGYAGITRRGRLEHLLTTEWGLLDTAPEEFLRRLSTGELSYWEPEHKAQTWQRRCLVLFDSGPEQLGAPRLAQLAAWIVLETRARAAGAGLQWATLDREPQLSSLHNGLDSQGVRSFLSARTAVQASPRQLYDWRKFAEQELGSPDELWLLGGPHWLELPLARGVHLLSTEESASGEELQITLRPRNQKLTLPLPHPELQIRLLRDPLPPAKNRPHKARSSHRQGAGRLIWLPGARAVCARESQGSGVLVYPIPSKLGASLGPPRLYQQPYGKILAMGGHRSTVFGVVQSNHHLEVRTLKGSAPEVLPGKYLLTEESARLLSEADDALTTATLWLGESPQLLLRFPGLNKTLSLTQQTGHQHWSPLIAADLPLLPASLFVGLFYVSTLQMLQQGELLSLGVIEDALLFSGPSPKESVVVRRNDGLWYLPLETRELAFPRIPSEDTLLGATYFGGQVRLVTLSEAGRTVRLVGLGSSQTLTGIGGKLMAASVSPDQPLLAGLRESGDLVIWDLETDARRCQFHAPRESFEEVGDR